MEKNFDIFLNDFSDEEQELEIFREYAIDFKTGEYLRGENNDVITLEKNEAVKVWIYKALKTERFRHFIYSSSYGSELREHIGTVYNKSIKDALMINEIKDCLLVNPYILECYDFNITYDEDTTISNINFTVLTVYGHVEMEVNYER